MVFEPLEGPWPALKPKAKRLKKIDKHEIDSLYHHIAQFITTEFMIFSEQQAKIK